MPCRDGGPSDPSTPTFEINKFSDFANNLKEKGIEAGIDTRLRALQIENDLLARLLCTQCQISDRFTLETAIWFNEHKNDIRCELYHK